LYFFSQIYFELPAAVVAIEGKHGSLNQIFRWVLGLFWKIPLK